MEEIMPKMARRRGSEMRDNPGRGVIDPAMGVRRRRKKNSPSVTVSSVALSFGLSAI